MTAASQLSAALAFSDDSHSGKEPKTDKLASASRQPPALRDSSTTVAERRLVRRTPRRPLRIYVASSIRNERFAEVVQALQAAGHDVYNFREQPTLFPWSAVVGDAPCCSLEDQ